MKLTILGEYGPFAPAGGACSSYLLQGKHGGNILLDFGNGGLAQMQKYLSISQIDAVVLTHLHFDHISDLQILGYALSQLKLPRKPALYLPKTPEKMAQLYALPVFDVHSIQDDLEIQIAEMKLVFAKMTHPVEAYAVMAEEDGTCLLYSGDTTRNHAIEHLAEMADFALLDAGLLEAQAGAGAPHMSVGQACEVGRFAGKMVLTHFSPLYTREQIRQEAMEEAILAKSGMTFEI
ncbi:MAG: MBL fold metallo-hydrolase [Clostridiales bacterium]|nr:MBL fold metallo-hydrolase [Clostridiales bacterium]